MMGVANEKRMDCVGSCYADEDKQKAIDAGYKSFKFLFDYMGSKKFLVFDYPTIPDFMFYEGLVLFKLLTEDKCIEEFTNCAAYMERMENLPNMKAYMNGPDHINRPVNNGFAKINFN